MTNTLVRRLTAATFATMAAIGATTLFALPAHAHASAASGVAECVPATGSWKITWTLTNDMDKEVGLTDFVLNPEDAKATKPTSIAAKKSGERTTSVQFVSQAPAGTTSAKISYTATWAYNGTVRQVQSGPVKFNGTCTAPTSTASPVPSPSRSAESSPRPSAPSSTTPSLPVTGSSTTGPMIGAGAALVLGGAVLLVVLRRRRQVRFTTE